MNLVTFHNRILRHQSYSCFPTDKNLFSLVKIVNVFITITPRKSDLTEIVIVLASLELLFKNKISIRLSNRNGSKVPVAAFQIEKSEPINLVKDVIFNFIFFNQSQLVNISHNGNNILFFNIHILRFSVLHNFYRYMFNIPRLRISFTMNKIDPNELRNFTSLFRIPL